jgi:hypothetical protein
VTDSQKTASRPIHPRAFQDDLLQDLRGAAPASDAPSDDSRTEGTDTPAAGDRRRTPTLEVRLTPMRWLAPSLRREAGGRGMVLTAGPLSVSVDLFRR